MKVICPNCRSRVKFSFWRLDAMKLICPMCHTYIYKGFRAIEAITVIAEIYLFYMLVSNSLIKTYMIPVVLIGLVALEYMIRYAYIWVQNRHNKNKY